MMIPPDLAPRIDLAILKPEALAAEVHKVATDAMRANCRAVCVAPVWVARVARMVEGSGVRVCSAVGFPHGTGKSTLKAIEATSTSKDGADEIDVVAHLPLIVGLDLDAARAELMEIVRAARSTRRDAGIFVIVETALLSRLGAERSERAFEVACRSVRESGCDGVATASGFHPAGGATAEAVRQLKRFGEGLIIKAAGGVTNDAQARELLDAGADRVRLDADEASRA
ncbi:MAG: deoxyribose-phosphate aldolase [Tepidisphaeraceae bacterium]